MELVFIIIGAVIQEAICAHPVLSSLGAAVGVAGLVRLATL